MDWNQEMMDRIRALEYIIGMRYYQQEMRCPVHLCGGAEHIAVGVCNCLRPEDHVYSGHRSHAHYLARGGDLKRLVAELMGKQSGCSGGRGGSQHIADPSVGFMGTSPILAAQVPVAVGDAWGAKLSGSRHWVVVFLGDGATEEGVFYESVNFAQLHNLSILFVVEDNGLAVDTPKGKRRGIHWRQKGSFSIPVRTVEEHTVEAVATVTREVLTEGPAILWCKYERLFEHVGPRYSGKPPLVETSAWREVEEAFRAAKEEM